MRALHLPIPLLLLACSSKTDDHHEVAVEARSAPKTVTAAKPPAAAPAAATSPAATQSETPTTTVPALEARAAAGKAYFIVEPKGIVQLDHGKLTHPFTLPDKHDQYARGLARTPSGELIVEAIGKLYRIANGKVSRLAETPISLSGSKLIPAPDGSIWLWTITTVGHFANNHWTEIKSDSLGDSGIVGMTVGGDGAVWLAEQKKLFKWDGSAFKPVTISAIGDALLEGIVAAGDGKVYVVTSNGIVELGASPHRLDGIQRMSISPTLVPGPEGRVAIVDFSGNVNVIVPPGNLVAYPKLGTNPDAVAFDGGGRIWISTKTGLVVYDATGKPTSLPTGSLPMLAGKLAAIVVDGGGPELPVAGEVERGRVKGVVSSAGGVALAGAKVEICAEANMMYDHGKSPCAGEPFTKQTMTSADGEFAFDEVPVGTWSFAVLPKPGDKWVITFRNFCSGMKKGETCNAPLQL